MRPLPLIVAVVALYQTFRSTDLAQDSDDRATQAMLSVAIDMTSTKEISEQITYSGSDGDTDHRRIDVPAAKIILQNSGEQSALVREINVHVAKVWTPQACDGAGPALTSVIYDYVLPGDIDKQRFPLKLPKSVDFTVAGQSDDRLAVTVGEEQLGETGWAWITLASVEITLADGHSIMTDQFVLMNSSVIDQTLDLAQEDVAFAQSDPEWAQPRIECIQGNFRMLEEALSVPVAHSPSVQVLLDGLKDLGFTATELSTGPTPATETANPNLGTWVAQLASLPDATTTATQAQAAETELEQQLGIDLRLDTSSAFESLNPGYWVLYYPGDFADGHAALAFCINHGITDEQRCAGRYFSSDTSDKPLNCHFSNPHGSANCIRQ